LRPLSVKPGDKVLVGKYAGTELKLDGVEYVVLREDDLFGVIEQ
jgi:chaperonin GroES